MVKGFTPLIGLAVVVALALAAVFGSISLANPAMAAIGQPADAELTERVVSPQAAPSNLMAKRGDQSVALTWDDQDGTGPDDWQVSISYKLAGPYGDWLANNAGVTVFDGVLGAAVTGTDVRATVTGRTNGTSYCFKVRSYIGNVPGSESNSVCATPNVIPAGTIADMKAEQNEDEGHKVDLSWTYAPAGGNNAHITGWEYRARKSGDSTTSPAVNPGDWMGWKSVMASNDDGVTNGHTATVDAPTGGVSYDYQVRPVAGDLKFDPSVLNEPATSDIATASATAEVAPKEAVAPTFSAGSTSSRSNTSYKVMFQTGDEALNTLRDELVIEFHEDYILPDSISTSAVTIGVDGADVGNGSDEKEMLTFNPSDIVVDGEKAVLSLGDMNEDDDVSQYDIAPMAKITVNFWQSAGIRNPTEAGSYSIIKIEMGDFEIDNEDEDIEGLTANAPDTVRRKISLSEEDGGLGDMVMVTGKGFENGVTLHFFLDKDKDGRLASGEDILCSVAQTSGENVGSCEFKVTTPTFQMGENYINAVDGDGNEVYDPDNDDSRFELKASISATPAGGSPGEIMQVRLVSFTPNKLITRVKLQGKDICGGTPPGETKTVACKHGSVNDQGSASISVTIPNWAVAGLGELRVYTSEDNDNTNVTIEGPRIVSTPQTVVANQRVSLVGTGFSPRSIIGDDDLIDDRSDSTNDISKITIGGHLIDQARINNGRDVQVDDGGNWSASVNLPLVEATTGEGDRTIRITDSKGRTGTVDVTLAERDFDITPPEGRVGTIAVVRGVGYPSKNDEGGDSFTVDVVYKVQEGTSTRVSVVPDASGRFEVQIRIPTTASIPSTNQVEVKFRLADGTEVLENKQHIVPEGVISLSETSGGPGSTITVSGEGYKAFVNVDSVSIGNFDMTPAPKPHTNGNGMMSFDILIPGLDVGIQTIEVKVGGTTSSTGFTVTESGINPGEVRPVAEAIEDLGDNLVSVWHFNNDTKAWAFYSPDLAEGNTLTHMITGETYLIRIKSTVEVILNRDTRNLTCVADNCWNQVVW
jgi:hypothetical protein